MFVLLLSAELPVFVLLEFYVELLALQFVAREFVVEGFAAEGVCMV